MLIRLIRHGETEYNAAHRYQGLTDTDLSDKGRAELKRADFDPDRVYVSPLIRAVSSAKLLFPESDLVVVPEFCEMDFGVFEGRSYRDMEHDDCYRAWVDSGCEDRIPEGESKSDFSERVNAAFEKLCSEHVLGNYDLTIVAHGGTLMAIMEKFAVPEKKYFDWHVSECGGFSLRGEKKQWEDDRKLQFVSQLSYSNPELQG